MSHKRKKPKHSIGEWLVSHAGLVFKLKKRAQEFREKLAEVYNRVTPYNEKGDIEVPRKECDLISLDKGRMIGLVYVNNGKLFNLYNQQVKNMAEMLKAFMDIFDLIVESDSHNYIRFMEKLKEFQLNSAYSRIFYVLRHRYNLKFPDGERDFSLVPYYDDSEIKSNVVFYPKDVLDSQESLSYEVKRNSKRDLECPLARESLMPARPIPPTRKFGDSKYKYLREKGVPSKHSLAEVMH